ncbi:MAG: flagellar export protein FliJ [Planctomycetes bacterium]|nr:flagellar export protein FliJ [Planctomycetota bacterium]
MSRKFRLATLLKIRERERDQAGQAVSDALIAIAKMDDAKRDIDEQNRAMDDLRKQSSHGLISLGQILDAQRYQLVLAAQAAHIAQDRSLLVQELERRQAKLLKCQQSVKSLEKLRDNRFAAEDDLALKKEQERLDEWSNTRVASTSAQHAANESATPAHL